MSSGIPAIRHQKPLFSVLFLAKNEYICPNRYFSDRRITVDQRTTLRVSCSIPGIFGDSRFL
jgi:hypothetical protein